MYSTVTKQNILGTVTDIYKSFGFNKFFDGQYYDMNEKDVVNYGLKDKPFL